MIEEQKVNEKYFEYYVETLTQTLNQQVLANVSLQAKARVNGDALSEWQKENEILKQELDSNKSNVSRIETDLKSQIDLLKANAASTQSAREQSQNTEIERLKGSIAAKDNVVSELRNQVAAANAVRAEHEKIKHQVAHIDTFRSQLVKLQEVIKGKDSVIEELNGQIEYLKLTPAKRKKLDEKNNPKPVEEVIEPEVQTSVVDFVEESIESEAPLEPQEEVTEETSNDTIRDGGSF
jgi:chromosome segregation ATPase